MYTVQESIIYELIVNKSRFICYLFPITSIEEAGEQLRNIRKQHYDATHNCYAYIIDSPPTARSSDDGEPAGTAGIVIYEVLKKNDMTNILAIVTRYFGGVKLGAGGLIRAYGGVTAKALNEAVKLKIEQYDELTIELDYPYYGLIEKNLEMFPQIFKQFTNKVTIKLQVPENNKGQLIEELTNLTGGNITIY